MAPDTTTRTLPTYRFASFELRLESRALCRDGIPCHLEPRTYDLLVHLLSARDRVVTKDELLQVVWDGITVCDGALSQCVSVLRKTLGDSGRQQSILRTFPRIGYRFVCPVDEVERDGEHHASATSWPPLEAAS